MTTQKSADTFGNDTRVIDAQAFDNIQIYVDRDAALLAGYDRHGAHSVEVQPSALTERQRQTLIACHYCLTSERVGIKINGTQSLVELLDLAADKLDAEREKEQQRIEAAVEHLTGRLLDGTPYNPFLIESGTGKVSTEANKHAPLQVSIGTVSKAWEQLSFFYDGGFNNYNSDPRRAERIRDKVLSHPGVVERLDILNGLAAKIQADLDQAKQTRQQREDAERIERELAEAQRQQAQREQRAEFVFRHMSDLAQQRYTHDLLSDQEIDTAMEIQAFTALDEHYYTHMADLDGFVDPFEVRSYLAEQLALCDEYARIEPEATGRILHIVRPMKSCTDAEFLAIQAMKSVLADADYQPVEIAYYVEDYSDANDPEYRIPAVEIRVTVGAFTFTRLYNVEG